MKSSLFLVCLLFACAPTPASTGSGSNHSTADAGTDAGPLTAGPDTTVTVFSAAHMSNNNRQMDSSATLPTGQFTKIMLHWTLSCPPAGCDPWDRIAELHVVRPESDGGEETVEVGRLITPYGVGATWDYDVTDLAPLLTGPRKFRLFVDTWVDGWMNDITLEYTGGLPDEIPVEVTNLWRNGGVVYGDPERPTATALAAQPVTRAENETLKARVIMTGHGQGNLSNCAEFCQKQHHLVAGSDSLVVAPWRGDCNMNPVSNQHGSWTYPRAGWCPGSDVHPIELDLTPSVASGSSTQVSLELADYENSCRPGPTTGMTCNTCASGNSCDYNYNGHTEPFYDVTVELIRFRAK
jgi:hypothetical protein